MPKKQLEVLVFKKNKIEVTVSIDYINKTISLVKPAGNPFKNQYEKKEYIFIGRNAAFMPTWLNILDAMSYAIKEAKSLLDEAIKEEANFDSNILENTKKKIVKSVVRKITKAVYKNSGEPPTYRLKNKK
jgi:hypothetical protein